MKYLFSLLLITVSFISFSQHRKIKKRDLPELVKADTIVLEQDVWMQTPESEIQQRHKFKKIKELNNKIRKNNVVVDSLVSQIMNVSDERDSLLQVVIEQGRDNAKEAYERLLFYNAKVIELNQEILKYRKKNRRLKRLIIGVFLGYIPLVIIIIL